MKKTLLSLAFMCISVSGFSQQRQPYQYSDPQQLDISNLGNAATTLQNRYSSNTERVQYEVDKIIKKVYRFEIDDEQKEEIVQRFRSTAVKSINSQRIDYSSINTTNSVINYLYESMNQIIKDVTNK